MSHESEGPPPAWGPCFPEKRDVLILTCFFRSKCCWIWKLHLKTSHVVSKCLRASLHLRTRKREAGVSGTSMIQSISWAIARVFPLCFSKGIELD